MSIPKQYFRAGAGSVIINAEGLVLALERADVPHAWQMPQGGLKRAEDPLKAALREVAEETGIQKRELDLIDSYPEPLVYELPAGARNKKTGRGQVQYWFLFRFRGKEKSIDLGDGKEFIGWKWVRFQTLLKTVVTFRKPLYHRLAERFGHHFA